MITTDVHDVVLDIKDLCVSYFSGKTVLDHVSFSVQKGHIFGLIGLNGEGKTTIIKTLLNLRIPQKGQLSLFAQPHLSPDVRAYVSYLPERFDPPWFLTGMDFVRFSASLYGRTIKDQDTIDYAHQLGLDPSALSRRVNTYSKGMRQKLGLIATFSTGCDLFILDEPMSGLDPRARVQVKNLLLSEKVKGKTIFLSSHILSDLDEMCDQVAVLHQGHIRYRGTPDGLRQQAGQPTLEKAFLSVIEPQPIAV